MSILREHRLIFQTSLTRRLKFGAANPELSDKQISEKFKKGANPLDLFRTILGQRGTKQSFEKKRTSVRNFQGSEGEFVAEGQRKAKEAAQNLIGLQRSGVDIFEGVGGQNVLEGLFGGDKTKLTLADIAEGRFEGFEFSTGNDPGDAVGALDRALRTQEFNRQNQELQAGLRTSIDEDLKADIFPDQDLRATQLARTDAREQGEDVPTGVEVNDPNLIDPTDPIAARTLTPERTTSKDRGQAALLQRFQDDVASGKMTSDQALQQIAELTRTGQFDGQPGFAGVDPETGIQFPEDSRKPIHGRPEGRIDQSTGRPIRDDVREGLFQKEDVVTEADSHIEDVALDIENTKNIVRGGDPALAPAFTPEVAKLDARFSQIKRARDELVASLTDVDALRDDATDSKALIRAREQAELQLAADAQALRVETARINQLYAANVESQTNIRANSAIASQIQLNIDNEMKARRRINRLGIETDETALKGIRDELQSGESALQSLISVSNLQMQNAALLNGATYQNAINDSINKYEIERSTIQGTADERVESVDNSVNKSQEQKDKDMRAILKFEVTENLKIEQDLLTEARAARKEMADATALEAENNRKSQIQAMEDFEFAARTWGDKTPEAYKKYLRDNLPNIDVDSALSVPTINQAAKNELKQADEIVFGLTEKSIEGAPGFLGILAARAFGRRNIRGRLDEAPIMHGMFERKDEEGLKEQILVTVENSFDTKTRRELDGIRESQVDIDLIQEKLKGFDNKYGGIFKTTLEGGRKFIKQRDADWVDLKADIGSAMAETRKKFAGVAVTDTELASLNQFLVDFQFDTVGEMNIKLDNVRENLLISKQSKYEGILGQNKGYYKYLSGEGIDFSTVPNAQQEQRFNDDFFRSSLPSQRSQNNNQTTITSARTDRHNNPTALAWSQNVEKFFKSKGHDASRGDAFPNDPNQFTLDLSRVEDPIQATIDYIDEFTFFFKGNPRWTHTAIQKEAWDKMGKKEKARTIKDMYRLEGGTLLTNLFV